MDLQIKQVYVITEENKVYMRTKCHTPNMLLTKGDIAGAISDGIMTQKKNFNVVILDVYFIVIESDFHCTIL